MHQSQLLQHLKVRLSEPLPGLAAQLKLAPDFRPKFSDAPDGAKRSAVMILLTHQRNWHVTFILRSSGNANDRHAGQISFPGGKYDPDTDTNLLETALRETHEEIGVPNQHIQVLGPLTQLYIPVSNFSVQPYIGYLSSEKRQYQPQPSEVADIIESQIADLKQPPQKKILDLEMNGQQLRREVPYLDLNGRVLWGATAMIVSELLAILPDDLDAY